MLVKNTHFHSIWFENQEKPMVKIIDQRHLPFDFVIEELSTVKGIVSAIKDMHLRGAPLIGVAAAYGVYFAALDTPDDVRFDSHVYDAGELLKTARPTAVNLSWAVDIQLENLTKGKSKSDKIEILLDQAHKLAAEDIERCRNIGKSGLPLIENIAQGKNGEPVNILTHCNAGWLACVDYGTATSPIYMAHDQGIHVHVWVDETRPRNQGARLTAWELQEHGVPHTVITDNTGGHLMQNNKVDLVFVGTDRTARNGDVANKIGTYLKALAAFDNNIPFYVAAPSSSIDWDCHDGLNCIEIEKRDADEVKYVEGSINNRISRVLIAPIESDAINYAFDVTPSRLVTGLITERGICQAIEKSMLNLFPEFR